MGYKQKKRQEGKTKSKLFNDFVPDHDSDTTLSEEEREFRKSIDSFILKNFVMEDKCKLSEDGNTLDFL